MANETADNPLFSLPYLPPEPSRVSHTPHSHSLVLKDDNTLIYQRKFFLRTTKNRPRDPSKTCALDFKGEFPRSVDCSVSATIGIDRVISRIRG
jgi:hypothetical protein